MFNFLEELKRINDIKKDYYRYLAEDFLKEAIKALISRGEEAIKATETFDIDYAQCPLNENFIMISAGANNSIGFTRRYSHCEGRKAFEKITEIVRESGSFMKQDKNSIHVYL